MARRKPKRPEEHVNHERWLVSYADFITLLFAFFVVMFAVSQVDSKKVGRFTQSFHDALEWQVMEQQSRGLKGGGDDVMSVLPVAGSPKGQRKGTRSFEDEKASIRRGLLKRLGSVPILAGLNVLEVHGELVLRLPEKLMFDRGEAILRSEGGNALVAIAEELSLRPVRIRVEGHSDSTPIRTPRFPSNWELSQSRAMAVVRFFLEDGKIAPPRLAAAGYGEHHPVAPNDTLEGKAQNRRVDLIVVADLESAARTEDNAEGSALDPAAAPEAPRAAPEAVRARPAPAPEAPREPAQEGAPTTPDMLPSIPEDQPMLIEPLEAPTPPTNVGKETRR